MKHPAAPLRTVLGRPYRGAVEIAALFALYAVYEVVRGFGSASFGVARAHSDAIVSLERRLHVFAESGIQDWASRIPFLPSLLGFAYITLHIAATSAVLVWVYRSRRAYFAVVRTSLVISTAISLVVYVLYPAAPPRLAELGFADTVTDQAHVNLSSDVLGSFYNPFAAVPSLHFGYALLVGVTVALLAKGRVARAIGWSYPAVMLLVIVATGNHFFFDAAGGALAIGFGYVAASWVDSPAKRAKRWQPDRGSAVATC